MVYGCQIRHVYSLGTLLHSCLRRVDDVRKRNDNRRISQVFWTVWSCRLWPEKVGSPGEKSGNEICSSYCKASRWLLPVWFQADRLQSNKYKSRTRSGKRICRCLPWGRAEDRTIFFHYWLASSGLSQIWGQAASNAEQSGIQGWKNWFWPVFGIHAWTGKRACDQLRQAGSSVVWLFLWWYDWGKMEGNWAD